MSFNRITLSESYRQVKGAVQEQAPSGWEGENLGGVRGGGRGRESSEEKRPHHLPLQASTIGDVWRPALEHTFHQVAQESNLAFNRSEKKAHKLGVCT